MIRKILPLSVMTLLITTTSQAQKKEKPITGYAITAAQKGQSSWKEVKLVDMTTGEELQSIYKAAQDMPALNARTGKPVEKKELNPAPTASGKKVVNLDMELAGIKLPDNVQVYTSSKAPLADLKDLKELKGTVTNVNTTHRVFIVRGVQSIASDKPFATSSAAMAYDKKHDRLYYTPMTLNQLRYIDLKSKTPKVYFFENEAFGTSTPGADAGNQITRMTFGSDGDGYALSNDGNHLIRFTTGKNPVITDLGALTDDAGNTKSVHSRGGFGGDMIADAAKNLYLVTAGRNVFKISIETKVATFIGTIKGLPQGFSTNGAMVEEGSKVIVCSSESAVGYYRFDLVTLQAEKVSTGPSVFNASDLANGNFAFDKKKKDKKEEKEEVVAENKQPVPELIPDAKQEAVADALAAKTISVYPNPVTDGVAKVSFDNLPAGKYQLQVLDMSGKVILSREVTVRNKMQIEELRLPSMLGKGNYLVKVISDANAVNTSAKLLVQ